MKQAHVTAAPYNGENEMENAEFKWNISDEMLITSALDILKTRACALVHLFSSLLSLYVLKRILFHFDKCGAVDDNFLRLNCFMRFFFSLFRFLKWWVLLEIYLV